MRILFVEGRAKDAASARLWCSVSLSEIAVKMPCDPSSLKKRFWPAASAAELALDRLMAGKAQRRERRIRWDVIVPVARALALAGRIPAEPLIGEPLDGPAAGTGSPTGGTTPPVDEKPVASRHRFESSTNKKNQNFAGGERGGSALPGAESPFHAAPGGTGSPTGGVTPPVPMQLTLDFEARMDAGQRETNRRLEWLCDRFQSLETWLRAALAGARRRKSIEPVEDAYGAGHRIMTWLDSLPWKERDAFLEACAPAFGRFASGANVRTALQKGSAKAVAIAKRHLQKRK